MWFTCCRSLTTADIIAAVEEASDELSAVMFGWYRICTRDGLVPTEHDVIERRDVLYSPSGVHVACVCVRR